MSDQVASRTVKIVNPQGLHARPANVFVRCASQFRSDIEVVKEAEQVDGKSILQLLTLAASEGTELTINASGEDAEQAVDALSELVNMSFKVSANVNEE